MPKELKNVELFSVGVWNGIPFDHNDLKNIAESFQAFTGVLRVPLKFGHNDEQPLTDGQPSIGWVGNVRLSEDKEKLIGDFTDLPEIVFSAMQSKLYNSLSIELARNVSYKGSNYDFVLEGVALLGADLPAVNTISDLSKYIDGASERPVVMSRVVFSNSLKSKPKNKDSDMTTDAEKLEALRVDFAKYKADAEKEKTSSDAELAKLKEDHEKEVFSMKKSNLDSKLEDLVSCGGITPAQRDVFSKKVVENDLASIDLVSSILETFKKEPTNKDSKAKFSKSSGEKTDEEGLKADQIVVNRAKKLQALSGNKVSFRQAAHQVLSEDTALAKEYVELTSSVGS